jgi:hypothetical protein
MGYWLWVMLIDNSCDMSHSSTSVPLTIPLSDDDLFL